MVIIVQDGLSSSFRASSNTKIISSTMRHHHYHHHQESEIKKLVFIIYLSKTDSNIFWCDSETNSGSSCRLAPKCTTYIYLNQKKKKKQTNVSSISHNLTKHNKTRSKHKNQPRSHLYRPFSPHCCFLEQTRKTHNLK